MCFSAFARARSGAMPLIGSAAAKRSGRASNDSHVAEPPIEKPLA